MAQMFTLSDNESDTSEDHEDSLQTEAKKGSPQKKQHLTLSERLKGNSQGPVGLSQENTSFLLYPGYTALQYIYTTSTSIYRHACTKKLTKRLK